MNMQHLSNKLQTIVDELNKFKSKQGGRIKFLEVSCREQLREMKDLRTKLNAALDELENTTLKELDEIRIKLQTSLKKDLDNSRRLKDDLQTLSEAVNCLCDKSRKDIEFISSRKCLDKVQESESYLKQNPVKVQSIMIFHANKDLCKQSSLWQIVDSIQFLTLKMNPTQQLTVKRKTKYIDSIPSDTYQIVQISSICSLAYGQVIVADNDNKK
ncbi:hypothetical protein DPMN_108457 [Dreissena polymorpha]|uniref:Uncharacterized protein n=1 Tax=Dreissena polymorpha TaxID=45954 RepID=A0A9D4K8X9_DREPO|nr:hypothetical protein DPMN_108457 [Dreissena polymorpha]